MRSVSESFINCHRPHQCEGLSVSWAVEGTRLALFQLRVKVESSEKELGNKSCWNVISCLLDQLVYRRLGVECMYS